LTSDILDCIEQEWTPRQKTDFFAKVNIEAIGFYPACLRVDTATDLLYSQKEHDHKKDYRTNLKGAHVENSTACHNWFGFSLGKEFIDILRPNGRYIRRKPR